LLFVFQFYYLMEVALFLFYFLFFALLPPHIDSVMLREKGEFLEGNGGENGGTRRDFAERMYLRLFSEKTPKMKSAKFLKNGACEMYGFFEKLENLPIFL
jgi:hypothetical protein